MTEFSRSSNELTLQHNTFEERAIVQQHMNCLIDGLFSPLCSSDWKFSFIALLTLGARWITCDLLATFPVALRESAATFSTNFSYAKHCREIGYSGCS